MMRKLFKISEIPQWKILEKGVVDEIIFRTVKPRNRLMLELMARGGMRIGEVLKLTPADVDERKLILREPKNGRGQEVVFIPQKLADRLKEYIRGKEIKSEERIFPMFYSCYPEAKKNQFPVKFSRFSGYCDTRTEIRWPAVSPRTARILKPAAFASSDS